MVLQVAARGCLTAAGAPGAAQSRGQAAVRGAQGQARVADAHRGPARSGLAGQQEHRRGRDGRDGPGRAAEARRKGTTRPGKGRWKAPDLVKRDFRAAAINQKWYGDGTDIDTDEGKLYLDSVLDVGSRRVLGFALGEHHDAELAYGALAMAVAVRGGQVPGVIMHTDQGSEYTAGAFRAACERLSHPPVHGQARVGAGQRGHRIVALHPGVRAAAHRALRDQGGRPGRVAAWIEDYNHHRRHSSLGRVSPVDYERSLAGKDAA